MNINWSLDQPTFSEPEHLVGSELDLVDPDFREIGEPVTGLPVKVSAFDIEPLRIQLAPYEEQVNAILEEANSIEVTDHDSVTRATELGVLSRKIQKKVEETRKMFKEPALEFGRSIDSLAKIYTQKAEAAASALSRKVGNYQAQVRAEELKRLKKQQEEAAALQAKIAAEAEAAGTDAPTVVIPKAAPVSSVVRTETGKATTTKRWVCEVTDGGLVPREYCEPVQTLLNQAIKAGVREIPGCKIYEETSARFGS